MVISPDGADVYSAGSPNESANGSIAEFSVGAGGALTQSDASAVPRTVNL